MTFSIDKSNFVDVIDQLELNTTEKMRLAYHLLGQCMPNDGVQSTKTPPKDTQIDYDFCVPKCKKLKPKTQTKLINTIKGFYKTKQDKISNRTVEIIIEKMVNEKEIFINSKGIIDWLKD